MYALVSDMPGFKRRDDGHQHRQHAQNDNDPDIELSTLRTHIIMN